MTYAERTQRAEEVKQLLDNPHLIAALDEMEREAVAKWKFSDAGELEKREEAHQQYVAVERFRMRLAAAIEDGRMAEYDQKQKSE